MNKITDEMQKRGEEFDEKFKDAIFNGWQTDKIVEKRDDIKSFISSSTKSVLEAACEEIEGMKRYHNKAHTWITDGWCHACKKSLTRKQLEDEFIYNQSVDDILALFRESAK